MTIPQYQELAAYWRTYPPTHLLMRALTGFKGDHKKRGDLGELLAQFAAGGA